MTFFRREAGLLQRFRDGESAALEAVYRAYVASVSRAVAGALRRYGHDDWRSRWREIGSELPDLVQEVFSRAFEPQARLHFDGVREYGPYLTQIARNVVVDCLRRKQRQVVYDSDLLIEEISVASASPDGPDDLADPQTMVLVGQYIAGLPADLRQVHEALYVQDLSQREAAAMLGLGRQVVRTLASRLREGLHDALKECGQADPSRVVVERPVTLPSSRERAR